jgi:hypothetical protein
MLLTKFIENNGTKGVFTIGKVYLANDGFSFGAKDRKEIVVVDEKGESIVVVQSRGEFQFLESVHAVWLGPPPLIKDWTTGDVKLIDQVEDDSFRVEGRYLNTKLFEILDETNLHPDTYVLDIASGKWEKIVSVDDRSWISIESEPAKLRPPTDFRFAIEAGSVVCIPIVTCIKSEGAALTEGRAYQLQAVNDNKYVVVDDNGTKSEFLMDRFK